MYDECILVCNSGVHFDDSLNELSVKMMQFWDLEFLDWCTYLYKAILTNQNVESKNNAFRLTLQKLSSQNESLWKISVTENLRICIKSLKNWPSNDFERFPYLNYLTCPAVECLSCFSEMITYRLVCWPALNRLHENVGSYPTEINFIWIVTLGEALNFVEALLMTNKCFNHMFLSKFGKTCKFWIILFQKRRNFLHQNDEPPDQKKSKRQNQLLKSKKRNFWQFQTTPKPQKWKKFASRKKIEIQKKQKRQNRQKKKRNKLLRMKVSIFQKKNRRQISS